MKLFKMTALALSLLVFAGCGEKEKKEEKESVKIGTQKTEKKVDESKINIGITGNDLMQYNTKEIKVKAGQEVTLTLRHIGQMDVQVMGHNFVLLKPGTEIPAFGIAANEAGPEKGYIPNDGADVIAHTDMIGGGQSTSITFMAPERGTYDFICSFPGHSGIMKGKFIVE